MKKLLTALFVFSAAQGFSQDSVMLRRISDQIMLRGKSYDDLRVLCKQIGHRLSATPQAAKAIEWGQKALTEAGADKVWLQAVDVPRWVRGKESLKLRADKGKYIEVPMLSLGNSDGTGGKVLEAAIVMVRSFDEFKALSLKDVKGKFLFVNYRFRQDLINTFEGYEDAGPYRWMSPNMASSIGAAGVIIRSISTGVDDIPHTGSMRYADTVKHIPAVAIGNASADMLEQQLAKGYVTAQLQSTCHMEGTVRSYNVIGEIQGTKRPDHIIMAGGHLDSWDVGEGAHDDGAGCVQAIEMIRTFKRLNIRPNNTIRAVLYMNEENGLKGGLAYGDSAKTSGEKHILAIESDAGGFSPRAFGLEMSEQKKETIKSYRKLFLPYGVYDFEHEGGGADISPLKRMGVPVAGLMPDPQRYFDLHHTPNDVFEAVNHRELKLGAVAITGLVYLVDEYGL
ncbi:MAG: M28 family peptidase [Sphingobacteriales bacterium]|nr:MAG: M28 family peptidase [Sphingobacteriales bacterium]